MSDGGKDPTYNVRRRRALLDEGIVRYRSGAHPSSCTRRTAAHATSPGRAYPDNVLYPPPLIPLFLLTPVPVQLRLGCSPRPCAGPGGSARGSPCGPPLREPLAAAAVRPSRPPSLLWRRRVRAPLWRRRPRGAAILDFCVHAPPPQQRWRPRRRDSCGGERLPERRPTWAAARRAPGADAGSGAAAQTDLHRNRGKKKKRD